MRKSRRAARRGQRPPCRIQSVPCCAGSQGPLPGAWEASLATCLCSQALPSPGLPQFPRQCSGILGAAGPGGAVGGQPLDFQTLAARIGGSCPPSPRCLWLCRASREPGTRGRGTSSNTPPASTRGATTLMGPCTTRVSEGQGRGPRLRGRTCPHSGLGLQGARGPRGWTGRVGWPARFPPEASGTGSGWPPASAPTHQ